MQIKKLAVLVSGGGSNLQSILDKIEAGEIKADICAVISDKENAFAIERAKKHGINYYSLPKKNYESKELFNKDLLDLLKRCRPDGIVLAGYLSILSKEIIQEYPDKIINIHPSLIPAFCGGGFYGKRVHQAVIDYGAKLSGATVHFVDEGTDTGAIIMQKSVPVYYDDDASSLAARVLEAEHEILPMAVKAFTEDRIKVNGRRVNIIDADIS